MPSLNSSNLSSADYDEDAQELVIEFRNGGRYTYLGVPPDVYQSLLSAGSPGSYFSSNIRELYSFRRG